MTETELEFHVSPEGDDAWSGRLAAPNADRSDGPLRTLEAAQAAVRRCKAVLPEPAELRVWVHGGVYELKQPLLFTAQDSGFPRKRNDRARAWPVTWAAVPGAEPVISGGRRLTGTWRQETVNAHKVWVTEIPDVAAGRWRFRQLWVDGQRRLRPRLPKQGVWQVERALDARFTGGWAESGRYGSCRFGYTPGQIRSDWRNLRDVEVQFFAWWVAPRARLTTVDDEERIAWFDRDSTIRLAWGEGDGVDFRLENVFEALTEPGEWYLDRPTGKLYYIPMPGEDPSTAEFVAPRLETLLRIDGAANLRFEGLTFAHSEWREPDGFADSNQASHEVPGALILHRADTCVFRGCRVLHNNSYAVEIDRNTIEAALEHCELRDMGAGGVRIWHGCRRNVVSDCDIGDGGHVYPAGVGVLIGRSTGNRIEHNHIHDLYYTGISAGWNWGYAESDGYGNLIEWNHIHDIGKGLLSDMGGIYLLGHAGGTRLRFNHIHDIVCRRYGGWCAYTDEGSSDVLIESNLCYRANKDAFHQHYGRNNVVRNNILAYGGESVLAYSAQEEHLGVTFESNILLSHDMPILRQAGPERWTPRQTRFQRNLYWCEAGAPEFSRPTSSSGDQWADWRRDHDPDGVLADPLFVDPQRGDFRLRPDSPALAMGFVPFNISQCGPRPRPQSL